MNKQEKRTVIFEFDTEEEFLGYLSDGGGEDGYLEYASPELRFDYKECFPDWGWNGKTIRKVRVTNE